MTTSTNKDIESNPSSDDTVTDTNSIVSSSSSDDDNDADENVSSKKCSNPKTICFLRVGFSLAAIVLLLTALFMYGAFNCSSKKEVSVSATSTSSSATGISIATSSTLSDEIDVVEFEDESLDDAESVDVDPEYDEFDDAVVHAFEDAQAEGEDFEHALKHTKEESYFQGQTQADEDQQDEEDEDDQAVTGIEVFSDAHVDVVWGYEFHVDTSFTDDGNCDISYSNNKIQIGSKSETALCENVLVTAKFGSLNDFSVRDNGQMNLYVTSWLPTYEGGARNIQAHATTNGVLQIDGQGIIHSIAAEATDGGQIIIDPFYNPNSRTSSDLVISCKKEIVETTGGAVTNGLGESGLDGVPDC